MKRHQAKNILNNSSGSTIILVVLILAVLTILGISSINTSTIELQISRNEKTYQENFYQAEAAAMEGAQQLEVTPEEVLDDRAFPLEWLKNTTGALITESRIITDQRVIARFSVVEESIAKGTSLDMAERNNMYDFTVRGLCDDSANNNGRVLIEIGYKKRH